jgi:hypothetical protein
VNTTVELEAGLRLQASSPAQDYRSEGGAQGSEDGWPTRAFAAGGQIAKESGRAQSGQLADERVGKTGKKGGQTSDNGMRPDINRGGQIAKESERAQGGQITDGAWGGQIAQVIPLSSAHHNSCAWVGKVATPHKPAPDNTIPAQQPADGQAASWIKSLLPESQSGWWEVGVRGKGFVVKFRWRDADRQTLLFPQITGAQFISLTQSGSGEAARILHERINADLHRFLLNPAKRDKALAVAAKLGIDLSEPDVHSLMSKKI